MNFRILPLGVSLALLMVMVNCRTPKLSVTPENQTIVYQPTSKADTTVFFKSSSTETKWVDSIYATMSTRDKVGQLFFVNAYSNRDTIHANSIKKLIADEKIGGLIFFQGGPVRQAKLTNKYQSLSRIPLFIGVDAEWGLNMRLDSTYKYPWNLTLGAVRDLKVIEKVGEAMGKENNRLGVHFNFAPVLDVNTNPKNPIIGFRSFGESKKNVAEKASALIKGQQKYKVLATGKHFPGHGDTEVDSHKALPKLSFSLSRLNQIELYPFRKLFDEGIASVMVAHLNIPTLVGTSGMPSSIAPEIVTDMLQKQLNYKGLIMTDGIGMNGLRNFKPDPGEAEFAAFMAGNDLLLCPMNVKAGVKKIEDAYLNHTISEERLAQSVKKILQFKYRAGLQTFKKIETEHLVEDLNPKSNESLQFDVYKNAITVAQNKGNLLPLQDISSDIAYVKFGDGEHRTFLSTARHYAQIRELHAEDPNFFQKLKEFETVIIGIHQSDKAWSKMQLSSSELSKIQSIAQKHKVILNVLANPYILLDWKKYNAIDAILFSYQNSNVAQNVSAQIIFGALDSKGTVPVTVNPSLPQGTGIFIKNIGRLGFDTPENQGMNSQFISKIDSLALYTIDRHIAPSAQILVARNGKVIFQKAYGYKTYEKKELIKNTDLYDLASITKMVATLPIVMQNYDKGLLQPNTLLGDMVPALKKSNKKDITFHDLLLHTAGMVAWIPFYKATLDAQQKPDNRYYRNVASKEFSIKVTQNLFLRTDYQDTIITRIAQSPMSEKKEYKYSDLTFILLKEYLEKFSKKPLDVLAQNTFFKSMGMNYTTFNPLQKFSKEMIVPTEVDNYYRYQTLQGDVHDMGAAMMGGVAGHAGLFSNAMDVAKMMQLFMQKGYYGGKHYFSSATFDVFNTCWKCKEGNRRGYGFDKPQLQHEKGPTCDCVSKDSFGHTGFTGNIAWADPVSGLVYIFLSNRTYPEIPNGDQNLLSREGIREKIQQYIQESIIK